MLATSIFVLLPLTVTIVYAEVTTVIGRYESFPKAEVTSNLRNGLFTYVTCYSLSDAKSSARCKITHSSLHGEDGLASCDVKLEGKEDGKINVHSLNEDNAAITWYSQHDEGPEYYIRYMIVNFNDCSICHMRIGFNDIETVAENIDKYGDALLINDDNTFDIFFESIVLCGSRICKLRFNEKGKPIGDPVPSFEPIEETAVYNKAESRSINESFVIAELDKTARFLLVTPDGQEILKETPRTKYLLSSVSTRYGIIRICSVGKPSSKINCETYDVNGQQLSKFIVDIGHGITNLNVYNLQNGEFIATTQDKYDTDNVHLTKISGNGQRLGSAEVPKLKCTNDDESFYADFDDYSRYCGTKLCYADRHVELLRRCLDSEDLS